VDIDDVTQSGLPVSKIYVGRSEMSKGDGLVIGRSHFEDPVRSILGLRDSYLVFLEYAN
jgi:hypothetical protein